MAALVWVTAGVSLWHFTVFVRDRFWSGIVGAFIGSVIGAIISGAIYQITSGLSIGQTSITTVLVAVPGALLGISIVYLIGVRQETREARA